MLRTPVPPAAFLYRPPWPIRKNHVMHPSRFYFVLFVSFVVPVFYSCPFVSIRGSCFLFVSIRVHSRFLFLFRALRVLRGSCFFIPCPFVVPVFLFRVYPLVPVFYSCSSCPSWFLLGALHVSYENPEEFPIYGDLFVRTGKKPN